MKEKPSHKIPRNEDGYCIGSREKAKKGAGVRISEKYWTFPSVRHQCHRCGRYVVTDMYGLFLVHGWTKETRPKRPKLGKNKCAECGEKALKDDYLCPRCREEVDCAAIV